MPSKKMIDKLNDQLNFEFYSANIYLQMSAWCEKEGLDGCAQFLSRQSDEEQEHMKKFFHYVAEVGEMPIVGALGEPKADYKSVQEIFETSLEHEKKVTARINDIAALAFEERDFNTFNFIQWFIEEQREEEATFNGILDKFRYIDPSSSKGLYFVDREIKQLNGEMLAAEGGEE